MISESDSPSSGKLFDLLHHEPFSLQEQVVGSLTYCFEAEMEHRRDNG